MDLEAFLREAVKDEFRRKREPPKGEYSADAWVSHRILTLVHLDDAGDRLELGVFEEFVHRTKPGVRRLVCSTGTPELVEVVRGGGWRDPPPIDHPSDTPDETEQIRRYLARRRTAEIKADLLKISADAMLKELLDD